MTQNSRNPAGGLRLPAETFGGYQRDAGAAFGVALRGRLPEERWATAMASPPREPDEPPYRRYTAREIAGPAADALWMIHRNEIPAAIQGLVTLAYDRLMFVTEGGARRVYELREATR